MSQKQTYKEKWISDCKDAGHSPALNISKDWILGIQNTLAGKHKFFHPGLFSAHTPTINQQCEPGIPT